MIDMHLRAIRIALKFFWLLLLCALIPSLAHAGSIVEVKGIRYSSYSDYTRVVIDLSESARFTSDRIENPDRLFIDLSGSVLQRKLLRTLNRGEGPLKAIRAAQFDPQTVRVVFDLSEIKEYKIFTLADPPRVVVDVFDQDGAVLVVKTSPPDNAVKNPEVAKVEAKGVEQAAPKTNVSEAPPSRAQSAAVEQVAVKEDGKASQANGESSTSVEQAASQKSGDEVQAAEGESKAEPPQYSAKSLAKQKRIPGKKTLSGQGAVAGKDAGAGSIRTVRRVVIDAGHGGHDPGASGLNGVREKDVVLDIAKRVKKILEDEGNYEVYLTRDKDKFLSLEERTIVANGKGADLFVSVHANAHNSKSIKGIETYFLNFTNDAEALKVAARENKISAKRLHKARSESEVILASLELQNNRDESLKLANYVQGSVVSEIDSNYGPVRDLGVKQALFYVLFGAKMPSVLVEVAFITNPVEAKRLKSHTYREHLASGIAEGIDEYFETLPPEQQVAMRY